MKRHKQGKISAKEISRQYKNLLLWNRTGKVCSGNRRSEKKKI